MKRDRNIKPKRGSLILYSLDGIKKESFEVIKRELRSTLKGNAGVYALYRDDKLVRVGISRDIYGRLKHHSEDKRIKWNNASLFILRKIKYLLDLETAIVRIAKPKYNNQRGRVKDEYYLKRLLKKRVRQKQKNLNEKQRMKDRESKKIQKEINKIRKVVG